jgi:hydrogenase maturation protein HypF
MSVRGTVEAMLCLRHRIVLAGAVQGVGMRPFVHRLADELGLAGFVGNDGAGAFIEIEGPQPALAEFELRLVSEAPPLARIESLRRETVPPTGETRFLIAASSVTAEVRTLIPPDTATCGACLDEIRDPCDRRYRHPFANCTDCGPRFTIIRDLPYDRPSTTMASFALCAACAAEYTDPESRRFHAQPISCPDCGPQLTFIGSDGRMTGTDAAIAAVHTAWAAGAVVAVKGIGGYHLTCDAGDDGAVSRLRARKGRAGKPFAMMVRELTDADALVALSPAEAEALRSPARPIVLAERRQDAAVSTAVAPGNLDLGIMLAYSGIHELLLTRVPGVETEPPRAIVATSGNRANEPICITDEEARRRLGDLADAFLTHDRGIEVPSDDSVVRVVDDGVRPVRRSRGYAPIPVTLPFEVPPTLAVGGELKSTICLADGAHAWLSQHIGDLENLETLEAFERTIGAFERMYRITPALVAVDPHPGYLSRRWVREHRADATLVEVQHHHAHVAALMAEHGLDGASPVIGVAFDGTGYGRADDGGPAVWGGELLLADYDTYDRLGHLAELPLPGGDAAVRNPWRVAVAFATACGIDLDDGSPPVRAGGPRGRTVVEQQARTGAGVVPTSSVGRLFDAVASLLDIRHEVTYEAQAAIELEAVARTADAGRPMRFDLRDNGVIDPTPVLCELAAAHAGPGRMAVAPLALGFHEALADAVARAADRAGALTGCRTVALTGGVFQNPLLSRLCRTRLSERGLDVLEHRNVPANDGGLALGQLVVAARQAGRQERI